MRYYTKDWYQLMQRLNYCLGMKKLPAGDYGEAEIQALYQKKRRRFIAEEKRGYDAPPQPYAASDFLTEGLLEDEDWQYIAELLGADKPPASLEEFSAFLDVKNAESLADWQRRPPFDGTETGQFFDEMYRERLPYALSGYPEWVAGLVDQRLLALDMLPEPVYSRLRQEEKANRAAFGKIERQARKALTAQQQKLPPEVVQGFCFHDATVLQLKKQGRDYRMLLNTYGVNGIQPYTLVTFQAAAAVEREKGLVLRVQADEGGELSSNCYYLYDELYALEDGIEVHMLLGAKELKYLTVRCRDISFEQIDQPQL